MKGYRKLKNDILVEVEFMNFTEFKLKERERDNFEKGFLLATKY